MSKRLITIIGARPQFVKAAVVSKALAERGATETLVHTGQHYDANMSAIFFDELSIPHPAHNLAIGGGSHGQNTGRMLEAIETLLIQDRPDMVMVYGDTDSTLAGALAASKLSIPIAHVEAGLRSFNRDMPEEINRVLTDHLSHHLFAPSEVARSNLLREGVADKKIEITGDVMFDAVRAFTQVAKQKSTILADLGIAARDYVLVTLHRKENVDNAVRLNSIFAGLSETESTVLLPLHPRTKRRVTDLGVSLPSNIRVIDPVGYLDMMILEASASRIATDSGGVQKEAYFHGVPCMTLRDETEWTELVDCGANLLVGADAALISAALTSDHSMPAQQPIYGSGDAAQRIALTITGA
jgi:UDP-GlcNAc3NAcA epimerase